MSNKIVLLKNSFIVEYSTKVDMPLKKPNQTKPE